MNYKCQHIQKFNTSVTEIKKLEKVASCALCKNTGPNLWICLQRNCLQAGCSEQVEDHSTDHFKANNSHCVHMNLSSQRIWCYLCEKEVFIGNEKTGLLNNPLDIGDYDFVDNNSSAIGQNDNDEYENDKIQGLVGLQNIANTCYMNSALQALSNIQPLTYYFLDCGDIIEHYVDIAANKSKAGLAKSYYRLIKDIWCRGNRSKDYVAPRGILYGIRSVHSMFRGFQQHDTQEFLRCFMDQLHEELKESDPIPLQPMLISQDIYRKDDEISNYSSSSASQSEGEYETCDSGVSEQSSLFEDSFTQSKHYSSLSYVSNSSLSSRFPASYGHRTNSCANNHNSNKEIHVSVTQRSIISDVFDGKLLSSVQCLTCDRISTREETFQDLSLPIPHRDYLNVLHHAQTINNNTAIRSHSGTMCKEPMKSEGWLCWVWNLVRSWLWGPSVTLHDCMASFFSADELKGDNMYSCSKCNKLRTGVKYSRVLDLPEALCIHLKRFRHDLSYSSKISSYIHFPLVGFDMRPYLHKDCKSNISVYNLVSVICHHGTVGGGHYTCFAKNDLTGNWYEFDDHHVTEVSADVVQNCQAYVLFYRKNHPQMDVIRAQAREFSTQNPPLYSDIRFFVSREWINRFNTFAEPGPINNWAILCPHGGVPPNKALLINKIAVPLSQPLWDFLYKKFGGGPVVNRLFECEVCKRTAENLMRRQKQELAIFTKYHDDFQNEDDSTTIYAISMGWFRKWQLFARAVTNKDPGPINNSSITAATDGSSVNNVLPGSDYAQLNTHLWNFFYNIYGGGPEIILRGSLKEEASEDDISNEEHGLSRTSPTDDFTTEPPMLKENTAKTKNVTFESENTDYDDEKAKMYSNAILIDVSDKHFKQPLTKKKPKVITPNHSLKRKNKRSRKEMKSSGLYYSQCLNGTYNTNNGVDDVNEYFELSSKKPHSSEPDVVNLFQSKSSFQSVLPNNEDRPIMQREDVSFNHEIVGVINGVQSNPESNQKLKEFESKSSKKLLRKQKRSKGKTNAIQNYMKVESGTSDNEP